MSFPKSFKTIEIMQYCSFGFTLDYIKTLCDSWSVIKDYAYIMHDKDEKEDGSPVDPHIHLMLRFTGAVPTTAILAKLKGVCEVQHLQKMKSWNSAIAYLTHANAPGKYQYDSGAVHSNFDWESARDLALAKFDLDEICRKIDRGEIREYNYTKFISVENYRRYKNSIESAFKYRSDRIIAEYTSMEVQEGSEKRMKKVDVLWLYGDAGQGKSEFAEYYCRDRGLDFYRSSSGADLVGEYKGQPAIILDDVRSHQFDASMLLKMLDNKKRSAVRSRYRNKWLEVELIIITCPQSPEQWWMDYRDKEPHAGPYEQLTRRLNLGAFKLSRESMFCTMYNDEGKKIAEFGAGYAEEYLQSFKDKAPKTLEDAKLQFLANFPGAKILADIEMTGKNTFNMSAKIEQNMGEEVSEPVDIYDIFPPKQLEIE